LEDAARDLKVAIREALRKKKTGVNTLTRPLNGEPSIMVVEVEVYDIEKQPVTGF
jgi:hypothetical protein